MKTAAMLQNLKAPKLFGELDSLVKAIGECKSKAEEDRIIAQELDTLKGRLSDPKIDKSRGREYMVRVMYCEMLGHDASFAYIPCLQFASDPNLLTKKAAYLTLTQLLDYKHELVLLLVNTLLSDLKSDNFVVVCSALVVTTKLIGGDLVNAVLPLVLERLSHPKEAVRKKAIMALHHFTNLDPTRTGALAGVDVDKHFRTLLCDKDPGVMGAALCALQDLAAANPAAYRNLIPSLASILKQVTEHRLPKSYDYHRCPAPFIQLRLLRILAKLGAGDQAASANMAAVVGVTLKKAAAGGHTIGHAIVYEAVRTITEMHPNPALLAAAAESVAVLLRSPSHNLKAVGLDALAGVTRLSPKAALEHQVAVIDCLEDPDDTLKLKALELLTTMTKSNNVVVVVDRLLAFLRGCADEHIRGSIATKVAGLAEKYAPDTEWFITVMAEVFELGGEALPPALAHNLMRLIAEQDAGLHTTAVGLFAKLLDRPASKKPLPSVLLTIVCWVLGEYGSLAAQLDGAQRLTLPQVMDRLACAVTAAQPAPEVRAALLTALTKLAVANRAAGASPSAAATPSAAELLHKADSSSDVELQQRALEATGLLSLAPAVARSVLPFDGSCEEVEDAELAAVSGLTFLQGVVDAALAAGAAAYAPPAHLATSSSTAEDEETLEMLAGPGLGAGPRHAPAALRFNAYEKAAPPTTSIAATGAGSSAAPAAAPALHSTGSSWGAPPAAAAAAAAAAVGGGGAASGPSSGGPSLALKSGGAGRRWGPAEFGGGAAAPPAAAASVPAAAAAAGPPAAFGSSSSAAAAPAPRRPAVSAEKERLAASLFGGLADSSSSSSGAPSALAGRGSRPAAAPAAPAAPLVDLLGDDDTPASSQPAAAAAAAGPSNPLDLLMDLGGAPPPAPAAAAGGGLGDLLSLSPAAPPAAAPVAPAFAAPGAAPAPAASNLMDLDSLLAPGPAPLLPGGMPPAAGGWGPAAGGQLQPGAMLGVQPGALPPAGWPGAGLGLPAGQGLPGGAPAPAKAAPAAGAGVARANTPTDPFKDLLG